MRRWNVKYRSISVKDHTFNEIEDLSRSLLPNIHLSKAQTIEKITDIAKYHLGINKQIEQMNNVPKLR